MTTASVSVCESRVRGSSVRNISVREFCVRDRAFASPECATVAFASSLYVNGAIVSPVCVTERLQVLYG